MKYLLLICLFIGTLTNAQFGIEAGYAFGDLKAKGTNVNQKFSANTFSIGVVYDLQLSETLDLQPGVSFGVGEKINGKSNNAIGIGAGLHYYFNNREAGFYAGPVLGYKYSLSDLDSLKKGALDSGLVLGYDITEAFTIQGGYSIGLSDRSEIKSIKTSSDFFGISLQYFFR